MLPAGAQRHKIAVLLRLAVVVVLLLLLERLVVDATLATNLRATHTPVSKYY